MSHKKTRFFIILLAAAIGAMATDAGAYVLQGPHVLELMAAKMGSQPKLLISQELLLFPQDTQEPPLTFTETVHLKPPDYYRSDLKSPTLNRIHLFARGESLTVLDGRRVADPQQPFDRYKDLLLYRTRHDMVEMLRRNQVDPSVSSLGNFQGDVAYVIGARFPDATTPQVWIAKESFLPLRWILPPEAFDSGATIEFRYLQWQPAGDSWWPGVVEFYRNGRLIRRARVQKVQVNPQDDGRLFDIHHLKTAFPPAVPDAPAGTDGIDELEKAVEDFQKILE